MKPGILLIAFVISLSEYSAGYAQQKLRIAGKMVEFPQLTSSNLKPGGGDLESFGVVSPLNKSKHDLEIRFYFTAGSLAGDAMVSLKGNKKYLWAECYHFGFFKEMFSGVKIFRHKGKKVPLLVSVRDIPLTSLTDSIFHELKKNGAFVMNSHFELVDSLRRVQPTPLDGYASASIAMKVGNQFHSFSMLPDIARRSSGIEVLARQYKIYSLFIKIYEQSGLKLPGW